ncbi:uncharacterized protein LOC128322547 [Hemicordylus capensis]|uniref:uncharacterized protein LOC128322547 n=1 Tax=Hemicordylus capensis TaxID=884348 RepID=UPI002302B91D|nr:uncharacterized protein LOC128322547 [Hemicordylus capensis]
MFPHGLAYLLWFVLLQDVFGFCGRPAWTTTVWEVTPQDLEQLKTEEQCNCLHNSVCQICHYFAGLKLSKGGLEILYACCKVALFMVAGLTIHYLLPKVKWTKDTKSCQVPTPAVSIASDAQYTQKMLYRLVANTSKMMKYVKHVAHRHKKELRYKKKMLELSKKKADEIDEDEQLFAICSQNESSTEDTVCMKMKMKQKLVPCDI